MIESLGKLKPEYFHEYYSRSLFLGLELDFFFQILLSYSFACYS